jgi:hypothetical protein
MVWPMAFSAFGLAAGRKTDGERVYRVVGNGDDAAPQAA